MLDSIKTVGATVLGGLWGLEWAWQLEWAWHIRVRCYGRVGVAPC